MAEHVYSIVAHSRLRAWRKEKSLSLLTEKKILTFSHRLEKTETSSAIWLYWIANWHVWVWESWLMHNPITDVQEPDNARDCFFCVVIWRRSFKGMPDILVHSFGCSWNAFRWNSFSLIKNQLQRGTVASVCFPFSLCLHLAFLWGFFTVLLFRPESKMARISLGATTCCDKW